MSDNYLITRIRDVLLKRHRELTWQELSQEIAHYNRNFGGVKIDRRKIAHLCTADEDAALSDKLTVEQLAALDRYFYEIGEGHLIARGRGLLDSITDSSTIDVFVSARRHPGTRNQSVSGWDMHGVADLFSTPLGRLDVRLNLVSPEDPLVPDDRRLRGGACISIGSPIANQASDILFSSMLGRAANPIRNSTNINELPFFIVGRSGSDARLKSGFIRGRSFIHGRTNAANRLQQGYRALVVGSTCFPCDERTDFAMLVAQRHPDTQDVQAVLSGLSGPGTYEVARILQGSKPMRDLPRRSREVRHPPILVAVYELTMSGKIKFSASTGAKGALKVKEDMREVIDVSEACAPMFLHYDDGTWNSDAEDQSRGTNFMA